VAAVVVVLDDHQPLQVAAEVVVVERGMSLSYQQTYWQLLNL
jgi:hypothetical protein